MRNWVAKGMGLLLLALSACVGGRSDGNVTTSNALAIVQVGPTRLLRLTKDQYNATVRDVLDDTTAPAGDDLGDEMVGPFPSNSVAPVSNTVIGTYATLADGVTQRTLPALVKMLPCDPNAVIDENACVQKFITTLGLKVYRRPLNAEEATDLFGLFTRARADSPFLESVRQVATGLLQSPYFLYRFEQGQPNAPGLVVALSAYERATRLSYFLWGSTPDDLLLAAAASGQLSTPDEIEVQARRLLASPKATTTVQRFFRYWLDIQDLTSEIKDPNLFPNFTPALYTSMLAETDAFVSHWFSESSADFTQLLTARYTFVDAPLAALYNVTVPTPGAVGGMQRIDLDPSTHRAGLLTQAAFLAKHAHADQTALVRRGLFVRSSLLCQLVPNPPPAVSTTLPPMDPNTTTRQRFLVHRNNPACAGCHNLLDPLGFGFEQFDAIGQLRTQDGLFPVDTTGSITGAGISGNYVDAVDEVTQLATSNTARACMVKQWYRFATGQQDGPADAPNLARLGSQFTLSQYDVRELLVSIARSDAMLYLAKP